jgi:hypothetical protein
MGEVLGGFSKRGLLRAAPKLVAASTSDARRTAQGLDRVAVGRRPGRPVHPTSTGVSLDAEGVPGSCVKCKTVLAMAGTV